LTVLFLIRILSTIKQGLEDLDYDENMSESFILFLEEYILQIYSNKNVIFIFFF